MEVIVGKINEELAQVEFNAFVEMGERLKTANEQLGRFAKLGEISTVALRNLNRSVQGPIDSFGDIQTASFAKAEGEVSLKNIFGQGGMKVPTGEWWRK